MTCYERLRQPKDRLDNYFLALEQDKTDEYHKRHGRNKKIEDY